MNESNFKELIKPDRYQVFLFTCPASLPFGFARHPWFIVNNKGVISRWEVLWKPHKWETSWGHLHKDFYLPTQGIAKYFFSEKYLWKNIKLLGCVEGEIAERMAELIENSPKAYPYCYKYSLESSNSNTYIQWVLNQFPESKLSLPWNAFGKRKINKI